MNQFFRLVIPLAMLIAAQCSSLPKGQSGEAAEALAQKMLKAAGYEAWLEVAAVTFVFRGDDRVFWDKKRKLVEVQFGKNLVQFSEVSGKSLCFAGERRVTDDCDSLTQKAVKRFYNHTFWINPAFHVMAPGTTRALVTDEGEKLLVSYASGGATPGDSYLFTLDDEGKIASMRMWVSILPIKGITAKFDDYRLVDKGIRIAHHHKVGGVSNVDLTELRLYATYPETGAADRFQGLLDLSAGPGSESLNRKK